MGADVEQNDANDHDAPVHAEGGTWVGLRDAATLMGVSVDTVKRRIQKRELESRRETIPQGFRWLVRVDNPEPSPTMAVSVQVQPETQAIQVPTPDNDVFAFLRGQLEERNREIASLLATVASQARALEHAEERLRRIETEHAPEPVGSPESAPASQHRNHTGHALRRAQRASWSGYGDGSEGVHRRLTRWTGKQYVWWRTSLPS